MRQLFTVDAGSTLANRVNRWFLLLTALLLVGFLALAMWQLWSGPAAEVRMEGIALGPVQLSIHDLAAIFMIASLAVAVLTNTWPFFVFRDLWRSGRFFYGVIFLLMSFGILVPVLVARAFAPEHVVIFIEWWEIALFAVFWGLETRRVARIRDNKVEKPDPDRGPLKEPYRTTVGEQSIKAERAREPARQNWAQPGPNRLGNYARVPGWGPAQRSVPRSVCRSSHQPADLGVKGSRVQISPARLSKWPSQRDDFSASVTWFHDRFHPLTTFYDHLFSREGVAKPSQRLPRNLWTNVPVDVSSDRDARVTEDVRYHLERHASGQHHRCSRMPQCVQPDRGRQPGALGCGLQGA